VSAELLAVHRSTVVFGSIFCLGLLAIGWQEYYPRSPLFELIGLDGPRARSSRRCEAPYSHRNFWIHPSRMIMCFDPNSFGSRFAPQEIVRVDAVSRNVVSAIKVWVSPDSTAWAKGIDSVSRALAAMGAIPYPCKFQPRLVAPSSWTYWKVRGYIIQVTALGSNYRDLSPYQIEIEGQRDVPDECVHPPPVRQSSNVCAGATLRVPLPGHYEWCWTSPYGL
jgi:hypothetical protein